MTDASSAIAAYRRALDAYNRRDADVYIAAFEERLACFHGQTDVPVSVVRAHRDTATFRELTASDGGLGAWMLHATVLSSSPTEVAFVDTGVYGGCARSAPGIHDKVIVMRREPSAGWRVHAETSARSADCLSSAVRDALGRADLRTALDACRPAHARCAANCESTCELEGSGCLVCWEGCSCQLGQCIGADAVRDPLCRCEREY